jgi:hypothetical protein
MLALALVGACGDDGPDTLVHLRADPVVPGAAIPDGRLVVIFYQLIDDYRPAPPLHIAGDVPLSGTATSIELSLSELALPTSIDDYRLCIRTCRDLSDAACDCPAGQPAVALAAVLAVRDVDGSGAIEPGELVPANFYGEGYLELGAAARGFPAPNPLDIIFPEGIDEGLTPYRIIRGSPFDKLGLPPEDRVFDLRLCVPGDASCAMLQTPNLS